MSYLPISLFAALLAAAGLPLYIHLPRFASADLGLSLSALGGLLIALRVLDVVQDPLLGRLADRFSAHRSLLAALGLGGMAAGFVMLFTLPPVGPVVIWVGAALALLFTAYSLSTILFYARGVELAEAGGPRDHYRLAGFRETGLLAGIVLAAALPSLLEAAGLGAAAYPLFGAGLAVVLILGGLASAGLWRGAPTPPPPPLPLSRMISGETGRLLLLALVNALPVAVTSTLFLFFVEDRLALPGLAGPFLILFFLAAGLSAPGWSALAARHGPRAVLLPAMALAIAAFGWATLLGPGAAWAFGVICVASGVALGADMVILPALFARTLARQDLPAGAGFGLWSFASKLALALAAALVLPALQAAGFRPGPGNTETALMALTFGYAVLPCVLKLAAIALVLTLPKRLSTC